MVFGARLSSIFKTKYFQYSEISKNIIFRNGVFFLKLCGASWCVLRYHWFALLAYGFVFKRISNQFQTNFGAVLWKLLAYLKNVFLASVLGQVLTEFGRMLTFVSHDLSSLKVRTC